MEQLIRSQLIDPVIIVKPDASGGPFDQGPYINSPLNGNLEDYLVADLISFIDAKYHTQATRERRVMMGHSVGGYGAMRLALRHPDLYGAVASHSGIFDLATEANDLLPCALAENGGAGPFTNPRKGDCIFGMFARASGFSPNPNNSPFFVDLPIDNSGKLIDSTWAKWLGHNPARLAKNYLAGARPLLAVYFDCGRQDDVLLLAEAVAFDDSLQQLGLAHEFQTYNGDHTNRLRQRFTIALAYLDSAMYATTSRSRAVSVSPGYVAPGMGSVTIQASVDNPLSHILRVVAQINSLDQAVKDSVLLYDDGAHNDGAAADGLWAGSWLAATGEKIYDVNVKTTDEIIGAAHIKYHAARFTTAGPVAIAGLIIDPADTVANPGDAFTFKLVLRNNSAAITAASVTADVSSSEACVAGIVTSFPNYGTLAPGKTAETEGFYIVNIAPNCNNKETRVEVNIASEGFVLWRDSLKISVLTTGIAERKLGGPERFFLEQNYPNPFNPETKIKYQQPKSGRVVLKVFNMLGEEVRALVDEFKPAGSFAVRWDGVDNAGQRAPSGVYLCRIETQGLALTRKMVLLQ